VTYRISVFQYPELKDSHFAYAKSECGKPQIAQLNFKPIQPLFLPIEVFLVLKEKNSDNLRIYNIKKRTVMIVFTRMIFPFVLSGLTYLISSQVHAQDLSQTKIIKNLVGEEISTDSIKAFLTSQMSVSNVPGMSLAIINDGKVVYHLVKGYADVENQKKVTNKTIFEGASLSKPLFAYFIMGFVEEGKLDLDKPLFDYLPYDDIAYDERYKMITARMVLSHTAGFPNWRSDTLESKLTIEFEPGTNFSYSGEGYQYLAKVLQQILDTDDNGLEVIFQKRVAQPLNLKYTKFLQDAHNLTYKSKGYKNGEIVKGNDDPTVFGSAYSVHSEALDFSKWVVAVLQKKGLSEESFSRLFEAQIELPEDNPQRQQGITDWTLGFAKASFPFGAVYGHGGNNYGYTSMFVVHPETQWGLVVFTNADQSPITLQLLQYLMTQ